MIELRKRDTTAESPEWVYLGEFFHGIGMHDRIRLAVYRNTTDHALHRLTSDEQTNAGPRLIAIFNEPHTDTAIDEWHPAWERDEMRPKMESQARDLARHP